MTRAGYEGNRTTVRHTLLVRYMCITLYCCFLAGNVIVQAQRPATRQKIWVLTHSIVPVKFCCGVLVWPASFSALRASQRSTIQGQWSFHDRVSPVCYGTVTRDSDVGQLAQSERQKTPPLQHQRVSTTSTTFSPETAAANP